MAASRPWRSVLLAMSILAPGCDAPPPEDVAATVPEPQPRAYRGLPAGTDEGAGGSLLAQYSRRDPIEAREASQWALPFQGKRIAVAMLSTAALDRLEDLPLLLSSDATWGLPDRREYLSRPVFAGDGGAEFLDAFRRAASRFKGVDPDRDAPEGGDRGSALYSCPPLVPGAESVVSTGAEPYWCFYQSDDRLDLLVFKLRVIGGRARIEYVGLFDERPSGPVSIPRAEAAPPLTPPLIPMEDLPDSALLPVNPPPGPPQGAAGAPSRG